MKKLSVIFVTLFIAASIFCAAVFSAECGSENSGGSVIGSQDDKYTPLYTVSPENSYDNIDGLNSAAENNQLFYTQTTLLALIAGYLILFKVKGIDHSEKMRRKSAK